MADTEFQVPAWARGEGYGKKASILQAFTSAAEQGAEQMVGEIPMELFLVMAIGSVGATIATMARRERDAGRPFDPHTFFDSEVLPFLRFSLERSLKVGAELEAREAAQEEGKQ